MIIFLCCRGSCRGSRDLAWSLLYIIPWVVYNPSTCNVLYRCISSYVLYIWYVFYVYMLIELVSAQQYTHDRSAIDSSVQSTWRNILITSFLAWLLVHDFVVAFTFNYHTASTAFVWSSLFLKGSSRLSLQYWIHCYSKCHLVKPWHWEKYWQSIPNPQKLKRNKQDA